MLRGDRERSEEEGKLYVRKVEESVIGSWSQQENPAGWVLNSSSISELHRSLGSSRGSCGLIATAIPLNGDV